MTKSGTRWLVVPALVGAALLLTRSGSAQASSAMSPSAQSLRAMVLPLEKRLSQPGLADFLTAAAWTESRFNTFSANTSGRKGLFQMSRSSANLDELGQPTERLFNARWSIALVAWYIERLRNYAAPGQVVDWLAIRRGMAYPHLVADVNENKPAKPGAVPGQRSVEVRERFEEALQAVGLPRSFMRQPAFVSGYKWPGIDAVLSTMGIGGVS